MNVVVALKPDTNWEPVIALTKSFVDPPANLTLLSLLRVGVEGDEAARMERIKDRVEAEAEALDALGYTASARVEVSAVSAGADIARRASQSGADLLVLGLGGRSRVGKALLGSDAQAALLGATVPVLCFRND